MATKPPDTSGGDGIVSVMRAGKDGPVWPYVASIASIAVQAACGGRALGRWARDVLGSDARLQETEQRLRILYGDRIEEGRRAWLGYRRECDALGMPASWGAFIAREFAPLSARHERHPARCQEEK